MNQTVIHVKAQSNPSKDLKYNLFDIYELHFYHSDWKDFISHYYKTKGSKMQKQHFLSLIVRISETWC